MRDEHRVEIEGQRESIAWCGQCGNISVDGINFTRVEDGLECAGCGAVSPHFEYVRKSSLDHLRDARGDDEAARCGCNELLGGHRWGDPPAARSPQDEDNK